MVFFMAYDFKFSVLMPIYNVEKYLSQAIDSLINQSIGFEKKDFSLYKENLYEFKGNKAGFL